MSSRDSGQPSFVLSLIPLLFAPLPPPPIIFSPPLPRPLTWSVHGQRNLEISSWGEEKKNVTLIPSVTASGERLRLAWIPKAKTYLAIRRMCLPPSIFSYHSSSGRVFEDIVVQWIEDVVKPHLPGKSGALVIDDYNVHWTHTVREKCSALKIQMIKVPPGQTVLCQPLDISVMGPYKQVRERE
jgi:hypothetical protein